MDCARGMASDDVSAVVLGGEAGVRAFTVVQRVRGTR